MHNTCMSSSAIQCTIHASHTDIDDSKVYLLYSKANYTYEYGISMETAAILTRNKEIPLERLYAFACEVWNGSGTAPPIATYGNGSQRLMEKVEKKEKKCVLNGFR